jgi:hypothetical protein
MAFRAICLAWLTLWGATPGAAESPRQILFVLDASRSMGEPTRAADHGPARWWRDLVYRLYDVRVPDGAPTPPAKLDQARRVLHGYVAALPAGTVVGLRVFGQRRWRGCEDSELLLELAPVDADRFHRTLDRIQPSPGGPTPIAYALRQGVRDFLLHPLGENALVLITDGQDSCERALPDGGDLLRAEGVDARVHLLCFLRRGQAAPPGFAAAATGTGGLCLPVHDGATLELGIKRALPITASQRLAAALHLQPGSWGGVLAGLVAILLLLVAWALVRSER